mmetsp:Transcript_28443/g.51400  ORF Transcript_28443/g.51400 Transcript_28443/m.51400 type:complete len:204 (+) Transcript_28443:700-1311(+)
MTSDEELESFLGRLLFVHLRIGLYFRQEGIGSSVKNSSGRTGFQQGLHHACWHSLQDWNHVSKKLQDCNGTVNLEICVGIFCDCCTSYSHDSQLLLREINDHQTSYLRVRLVLQHFKLLKLCAIEHFSESRLSDTLRRIAGFCKHGQIKDVELILITCCVAIAPAHSTDGISWALGPERALEKLQRQAIVLSQIGSEARGSRP